MITYKAIVIPGGRRKDGTWPVKIRVTFKGVARRLATTLVCTDTDLTRSCRIKNATILQRAGELIRRMRETTDSLSPFTLEAWDVDQIVSYIRTELAGETFRLDFIAFGREFIKAKAEGTRASYTTALNAFARFLGRDGIDVNEITRPMLMDFQDWADQQGRVFFNYRTGAYQATGKPTAQGGNAGRWTGRLSHIFAAAKERFNDEDAGRIVIPRSPFANLPRRKAQRNGQKALPVEILQRVIDARPTIPQERIALAAFVASFATMGANLADLYDGVPIMPPYWRYFRRKTADRRDDRAETIVRIEPETEAFLAILAERPGLRLWKSSRIADTQVNRYLRSWCEREGLEPFTFYAARHSWATIARRIGVEKATVDEALAHVGDFRVTDIYAERNWALSWEANRRVLDLFRWDVSDNNRTKSGDMKSRLLETGAPPDAGTGAKTVSGGPGRNDRRKN